jgi:phosphopantothenoylcysteine decarboxylase / phosphopantothenate---cysteine ligase
VSESLENKRVLLGVTGGIAAYKACELTRQLAALGAQVQVVMTESARQFVTPLSFQALSGRSVRTDLFDPAAEAAMGHIELARWADLILVAPASADFMAKLAHGLAPDLLTTLCLATDAQILLAPAMNRLMWANAATVANTNVLVDRGLRIVGPDVGAQACGETGAGRMSEPEQIVQSVLALLGATPGPLSGHRILINAGPTYEDIDPARFIGNRSSGRMGYAIAAEAQRQGADTVLISGPVALPTPMGVRRLNVRSASEMRDAVLREVPGQDVFIAAAAVADYRPAAPQSTKIKRSAESMRLELIPNPDIVAEVAALQNRPFVVGFAAETNDVVENAQGKLQRKKLDLICANRVGVDGSGFEAECNEITMVWEGGTKVLAHAPKAVIAEQLLSAIVQQLAARNLRR